jgi:ubiquinone/menaquinone biosynthesis C-methylase UbiE
MTLSGTPAPRPFHKRITPMSDLATTPAPPTAEAQKAAQRQHWDAAAKGWDDHGPVIRSWLADATRLMLAAAGVRPGARVLDLAAGAGDQTLDLARAVGPDGSVLATDLSPEIIARADFNARNAGFANVTTTVADAETLAGIDGPFDAAVCRLGLMFLPDPGAALRSVATRLHPGGRFAAAVFSEPSANPCLGILMRTALAHLGLPPADPFAPGTLMSLGRPDDLATRFRAAGFTAVDATRLSAPFHLPQARDYLDFIRASAAPILGLIGRLDPARQAAAWADIEAALLQFQTEHGWEGPNELLIVSGRCP